MRRLVVLVVLGIVVFAVVGCEVSDESGGSSPAEDAGEESAVDDASGEAPVAEAEGSFGNGTHTVGEDVQPGTYRSDGTSTCYWARLKGFSGELEDIVANSNNSPEIVTIGSGDAGFETQGCGRWLPVEATAPGSPATSFSDGTYQVGVHIQPGRYRADGNPDDLCYWARLSDFTHAGVDGVITNGNSPTTIEIASTDAGFSAFGCGNWSQA